MEVGRNERDTRKSFLGMSDMLKYLQPVTLRKENNNNKKKVTICNCFSILFCVSILPGNWKTVFGPIFQIGW